MVFSICAKPSPGLQVFLSTLAWQPEVSALVLQMLATQACGVKLTFSTMCLFQCLHCTDDAHIDRNSAPCLKLSL